MKTRKTDKRFFIADLSLEERLNAYRQWPFFLNQAREVKFLNFTQNSR